MSAVKYLRQIEKMDILIKSKEAEIRNLNEIATSITVALKDVAVQTSGAGDKIGDCASKIVDLQNDLQKDIEDYCAIKKDILSKITQLNTNEYLVLYKRYFESKQFGDIANEMYFSREHIYRLHKRALKNLEKMLHHVT